MLVVPSTLQLIAVHMDLRHSRCIYYSCCHSISNSSNKESCGKEANTSFSTARLRESIFRFNTSDADIADTVYAPSSKQYKKLRDPLCRNEEKFQAATTDEHKELFKKYTNCVGEYQTITDFLIFQSSFKLVVRMMLKAIEE